MAIRKINNELDGETFQFDLPAQIATTPSSSLAEKTMSELEIQIKGMAVKISEGLNQAVRNGVWLEKSVVLTK